MASKRLMVAGLMAVSSARTVSVMVYSLWSARNAIFSRIKTKRRLPHMQVKGCPYRLQRLIECLRMLFLVFVLLSFPRTANDNRKSLTSPMTLWAVLPHQVSRCRAYLRLYLVNAVSLLRIGHFSFLLAAR